jgi:hypothetical protein
MRKFWIGTAVYVTVIAGVIGGACAAFNALVGMPVKDSSQKIVAQMEPIQRTSGKWTPVEIKREPASPVAPPLPPYVAPRLAAANVTATMKQPEIMVAEHKPAKPMKRVVISRRGYPPETRQVFAYAPPEQPQFFAPFRFGF